MTKNKKSYSKYVYGNTAKVLDVRKEIKKKPKFKNNIIKKNRDKIKYMDIGYVFFLFGALCISGLILINYINLESQIIEEIKTISLLEKQYNDLKNTNDEAMIKLKSSIDLEEIKRIAIEELGMTYADESQIITYSLENDDYVRQYNDIPNKNR